MLAQNTSNISIENLQVTASRSSIEVLWKVGTMQSSINVLGYRVHYQKVSSSYIQYGPRLPVSDSSYNVQNLVPDTYYKICLSILRNDTFPQQKCVTASTESWDLPVSVGSSIGAILALAMIILLILMIRCRSVILCKKTSKQRHCKLDTTSTHDGEHIYDFSQTFNSDPPMTLSSKEVKTPVHYERRHRHSDSGTGAIPKRKPQRQKTFDSPTIHHSEFCNHNGSYNPRDIMHSHDRYHDNSVILHANSRNHEKSYEPDFCSSVEHETYLPEMTVREKRKQMHQHKSTFDSSIDSATFPADKLDIIMSFPNADSSSESEDCEIHEMTKMNKEHANEHVSEFRTNNPV